MTGCTKKKGGYNQQLTPTEVSACVALDSLTRAQAYYELIQHGTTRFDALIKTIGFMGPKFEEAVAASTNVTKMLTDDLEGHRWMLASTAEATQLQLRVSGGTPESQGNVVYMGATAHLLDYISQLLKSTDLASTGKPGKGTWCAEGDAADTCSDNRSVEIAAADASSVPRTLSNEEEEEEEEEE